MNSQTLALLALAGAAICWLALASPELPALGRSIRDGAIRMLRVDKVRVDLAQADLAWMPPRAWIGLRWGLAALAGLVGYLSFGLAVIGLVAVVGTYHLLGTLLEYRRREVEAVRQRALIDAIRYGTSVMSRAGNASQMLQTLADNGPVEVRPIFADLAAELSKGERTMVEAVVRARHRVADPLFDDISLALVLHWKSGGKLVPAFDAVVDDWEETLRMQRDAKAQRAGVEASVLILTILPFVFLFIIHLLAPMMLVPLGRPVGEIVLAGAVSWMVLGYRVLQRMSEPPREERIALREGSL